MQQQTERLSVDAVMPSSRAHAFIVGSTGSGKSTLGAALVDAVRFVSPSRVVFIMDYKQRFVGVDPVPELPQQTLFPDGVTALPHGRVEGVATFAHDLKRPPLRSLEPRTAWLVQDEDLILKMCRWLYDHADIRRPVTIYFDETADLMSGTRAHANIRRLLQQGREKAIQLIVINQRPFFVDQTFFSESSYLYVGYLSREDDRIRVRKEIDYDPFVRLMESPLPKRTWMYLDHDHIHRSRLFTLKVS